MGDEYDYGAAENWGGSQYGSPDPMNLSPQDPASPYWRPQSGPGASPMDFAPGTGIYQTGSNDWQGINAPGGQDPRTGQIYDPASYSRGINYSPSYTDQIDRSGSGNFTGGGGGGFGGQPTPRIGSGGGGGGSYQRPNLGAPERTLYDRYSRQLMDPSSMAGDPAYQFLYNQGEQALKRSLAAQRLTFSGKALNDTTKYGQGMAFDYMNKMLPQYQAGANEELKRYMGPAGLSLQGTQMNNQATQMEGQDRAAQDLLPYYQRMMDSGGGGVTSGIGYGGASSSYTPQPRLQQAWSPGGGVSSSPQYNPNYDPSVNIWEN